MKKTLAIIAPLSLFFGVLFMVFVGFSVIACQESTSTTTTTDDDDDDDDDDKAKVDPFFSTSKGMITMTLHQPKFDAADVEADGFLDRSFTISGSITDIETPTLPLKEGVKSNLESNQSILYEVQSNVTLVTTVQGRTVMTNIQIFDVELDTQGMPVLVNGQPSLVPVDVSDFVRVTDMDKLQVHTNLFERVLIDDLISGRAKYQVTIRAYKAMGSPPMAINTNDYGEFIVELSFEGPHIEFEVDEVTGNVHLDCRCTGEMSLTGAALTNFYTDTNDNNFISVFIDENHFLPNVVVPTDSDPIEDVFPDDTFRRFAFEVLTNGHPDLPSGASTLVRDGYFEVGQDVNNQNNIGMNYVLRIASPQAHALWSSSPTSIDPRITDVAATGDTRDIYVKVLVGEYDAETMTYSFSDPEAFDILKITLTIGAAMN